MSIANYQLLSSIGLSERAVFNIAAQTIVRRYNAGEVLCGNRTIGQPWRYLISGMAFFTSPLQGGKRDLIGVIGAGQWVGEAPDKVIQSAPLEILCVTELKVMEVPFTCIQHAFDSELNFCRYVARMLCDRHIQQMEITSIQRIPDTLSRVALCLAILGEKFQSTSTSYDGDSKAREAVSLNLPLPLNQTEIASICGISRSNLSQALRQFAGAGICQVQYSQVTLLHAKAWMEILSNFRNHKKVPYLDAFNFLCNVSKQERAHAGS